MNKEARKIIKDFRSKHKGKDVMIEYTGCALEDREWVYKHPDGTRITFPKTELSLLSQLREIPPKYLIPILGLDDEIVLQFINDTKKAEMAKLSGMLKLQWYDRYYGDPFSLNDISIPEIPVPLGSILSYKKRLTLSQIRAAISYLDSGKEVYLKEEE